MSPKRKRVEKPSFLFYYLQTESNQRSKGRLFYRLPSPSYSHFSKVSVHLIPSIKKLNSVRELKRFGQTSQCFDYTLTTISCGTLLHPFLCEASPSCLPPKMFLFFVLLPHVFRDVILSLPRDETVAGRYCDINPVKCRDRK